MGFNVATGRQESGTPRHCEDGRGRGAGWGLCRRAHRGHRCTALVGVRPWWTDVERHHLLWVTLGGPLDVTLLLIIKGMKEWTDHKRLKSTWYSAL